MRYIEIIGETSDLGEHDIISHLESNEHIDEIMNLAKVIDTYDSKEVRGYAEDKDSIFILGDKEVFVIFRESKPIDQLMNIQANTPGLAEGFLVWLTHKFKLHYSIDPELTTKGAKFFDKIASKGLLDAFIYDPVTNTKTKYDHSVHSGQPMYNQDISGIDRPRLMTDPHRSIWVFEQFNTRGGLVAKMYNTPRFILEKYPIPDYLPYVPPVSTR